MNSDCDAVFLDLLNVELKFSVLLCFIYATIKLKLY